VNVESLVPVVQGRFRFYRRGNSDIIWPTYLSEIVMRWTTRKRALVLEKNQYVSHFKPMNTWCTDVGIIAPKVAFKRSFDPETGVDKGVGLFAIRSFKAKEDDVVVSIPQTALISASLIEQMVISHSNATATASNTLSKFVSDTLGKAFNGIAEDTEAGGMDERKAIMLFLIWHKFCYQSFYTITNGAGNINTDTASTTDGNPSSPIKTTDTVHPIYWNAYMSILPEFLDTPVFYEPDSDEMKLLLGTGIDTALPAKLGKLYRDYEAIKLHLIHLQPGVQIADPESELQHITFERFKWADGIYW
jgi:hypothetical protein